MNPEVQEMYEKMKAKLDRIVPDVELRYKAEIAVEINALKMQRNAVILGHNYMEPALFHSIPDFTGDSLDLSRKAAQTDKDIIVFCGVRFMAETAKILNPTKTVLLPAAKAGCSLAASITAADVRDLKAKFPGVPVVTYVNTYADVKAESDICCTSSNAHGGGRTRCTPTRSSSCRTSTWRRTWPARPASTSSSPAPLRWPGPRPDTRSGELDYQLIGWHGRCEVHEKFTVKDIETVRAQFPDVVILAHPECSPEVTAASDFSGTTNAMIRYVKQSNAPHYLLLTECAMGDNIAAANPQKGHAAPVHGALPAHEHDHHGRHARCAQVQPLCHRGARRDPGEGLPGVERMIEIG